MRAFRQWIEGIRKKTRMRRHIEVDTVVLGSGPHNLMRAINERQSGRKVLIVDRQPFLGGAWAAHAVYPGLDEYFDVVAHLLSVYSEAYAMLQRNGFSLENRSIYFWDYALDASKAEILANLADDAFTPRSGPAGHLMGYHQYYGMLQWLESESSGRTATAANRGEFQSFSYFKHSFQPLIDRLSARYFAAGGLTELACPVAEIIVEKDLVKLVSDQLVVTARRLISGRHVDCSIKAESLEAGEALVQNVYQSLLVLARFSQPIQHRYVNVVGHSLVQAIQIARSAHFDNEIVYHICLVVRENLLEQCHAAAFDLMQQMQAAGIFDGDFSIIDARFHRYVSHSCSTRFLKSVSEHSPHLEFDIVDNMSAWMARHSAEWDKALA